MPVSPRRSPFGAVPAKPTIDLRVPQARVLAALMPRRPADPPHDWPTYNRAVLAVRAGYTAISGSITRALNGIREGSSSGDAHLGLLALGLVKEEVLDIDGLDEVNYRITAAGIQAYKSHIAVQGKLPELRDAVASTNHRYKKDSDEKSENVT